MTKSTYTADENAGVKGCFINLLRTNGTLGAVGFNFNTNFLPVGPGAATSNDFKLNAKNTTEPIYQTYWPATTVIVPTQWGWMKSDGFYGPSESLVPTPNTKEPTIPLYLDISDNLFVDGDRSALLGLLQPDGTSTFALGGETIPLGVAFGNRNSRLQIVDNDYYAGTFGFSATNYAINRKAGTVTVTILRTNGLTGSVGINFNTTNGTALAGVDYVRTNGTLTFGPGVASRTFQVKIISTNVAQADKFFSVGITFSSNPGSYGIMDTNVLPTASVVTIIDDNFAPGHLNFSASAYSVGETAGFAKVTVNRTGGSVGAISVDFKTADITATNGQNYLGTNGTLRWNNNDITPKSFFVPIIHDGIVTSNLTVQLVLTNPVVASDPLNPNNSNVLGLVSNAVLNIINEDFNGQLAFITQNFNVTEDAGSLRVTVARIGGTAGTVSAGFSTLTLGTNANLYAQPGSHYTPTSGVLTFLPGELSKTFDVPVRDNNTQDPNRTFGLILTNQTPPPPTNAVAVTNAIATIIDDETYHAPAGSVDTTYANPGFNNFVLATALQQDGKLVAGGDFTMANNRVRNRIARLNVDGTTDTTFGNGFSGVDSTVRAILVQTTNQIPGGFTNGPIVIAGAFDTVNNVFRHKIARLHQDGSLDETFNPGGGADGAIYALVETFFGPKQERQMYAAGAFGTFNGFSANGVVRLNDNGTVDPTFNIGGGVGGVDGTIFAMAQQADGKLIVGGDFSLFNGVPHGHLARLNPDGSLDATFNPDTGANGSVRAIVVQPDGKIVIGGLFISVNGTAFSHVARLNADGNVDPTFNVGVGANDSVLSLALDSQGRILVAGEFTLASGVTRYRLTRLASDGTVDPSINFGAGADNFVGTMVLQTDDQIIVGGGFTHFDNIAQGCIARLAGGAMKGNGKVTFTSAEYVVNENGTNAIVTLRRIEGTETPLVDPPSFDVVTHDESAVAGVDYVGVTNTITFPRGETYKTVIVPIIDNNLVDGDRFLDLVLANLHNTALGPQPYAELTIINDDSGVSFDASTYRVAENTPSGSVAIPVIRTGSTIGAISVDVATVGGSAIPFINYVPTTNTFVFNDGESNKLFRIQILNDGLVDGDQTVGLQLSNPQGGYLVSPNVATLTIAESSFGRGEVTLSQTNYSIIQSGGSVAINVLRTNGSTGPISVQLTTSDGSAIGGQDYTSTSVVVNFADGEISKTVNIPIVHHTTVQPNKVFNVTLSNPQGGAVIGGIGAATVSILDDHVNFTFASPAYFVRQDAGSVIVTVVRNSGTNGTVTVDYSTTNGPTASGVAVAGEDYTTTSGTLTFGPGELTKLIFIPIVDDGQISADEQFSIFLRNPGPNTFLGSPSSSVVTIINTHSGLSFSSPTYVVNEGASNALITVTRSSINTGTVTVGFSTADGTARAGLRYGSTNGVLTFVNGQATATFTVPIIDNTAVDGDQTVLLNLFNPSTGAQITSSNAVLTVLDNDIGLRFSSANYRVLKNGHAVTITVQRTSVTNLPASVDFATKDGSAIAPINYTTTNGTLSFLPGETAKTFDVVVQDNNIITGDKTVLLTLSNPSTSAVLITPTTATLTIVEDNGSLVVPAGIALLSESGPVNGLIDPSETVSLYFAFRNTGGGNTTNLIATLLNTNGVTNATAATPYNGVGNSASYGTLIENGPSVSQRFSFKANATNGQTITATFVLEDVVGGVHRQLGTGVFAFPIGGHNYSFTNSATITINDSSNAPTKATPYPSQMNVSGVIGTVAKVTATLAGVTHTYPDDIDALLAAPNNSTGSAPNTLLMAAVGGYSSISNVRLTFDDSGPALPNEAVNGTITTGTYKPTLGTAASEPYFYPSFPDGPPGPYQVSLGVFNGINPNGLWSLYIVDSTYHDQGAVNNGWILNLTTGARLDQSADLAVSMTQAPVPATVSNVVNYHITFSNYGPAGATNLVFTDALPAGMTYLSNTCNCTFSITSNMLSCPLAYLLKDGTQSFDIFVRADVTGTFTNTITVAADQFDPDPANNIASVVTEVDTPQADMAAAISISPNPVLINNNVTITMTAINNGFSTATAVMLTNQLPAGLALQSVSSSLGTAVITTNSTGLVVVALGNLPVNADPNTSPTVTITAKALGAGGITNLVSVRVASATFDPLKGNNTASSKVEIDGPVLGAIAAQNGLVLTWPGWAGNNFVVEQATSLAPSGVWTPVTDSSAVLVNGQFQFQVSPSNSARFFRLRAQ
ncbi:MAG: Calx-beta domain-containing protein [Limisphaerales bacterium]